MTIILAIAAAAIITGTLSSIANTPVDADEDMTYNVIEEKGCTGTHNEERKA